MEHFDFEPYKKNYLIYDFYEEICENFDKTNKNEISSIEKKFAYYYSFKNEKILNEFVLFIFDDLTKENNHQNFYIEKIVENLTDIKILTNEMSMNIHNIIKDYETLNNNITTEISQINESVEIMNNRINNYNTVVSNLIEKNENLDFKINCVIFMFILWIVISIYLIIIFQN